MRIAAVVLLVVVSLAPAWAQDTRAALLGAVADQSGAAVRGARVTATSRSTGVASSATTGDDGLYRIPLLPAGAYDVAVEAPGFATEVRRDLVLRVGEERRLDAVLGAGVVSGEVTIVAPVTESATPALSTVVPRERVEGLPLNGRQLQELALTAPGVTASGGFRSTAFNQFGLATPADGNAGAFSVNGAPSRSNGFFLDGVDINVPEQGVIAFPPLVEATREFQILTSAYPAEYGRYAGSIVNIVTRSGTNDWRGSAYEFFRNDALDANDFFNNANALPRTVLKQNQFGATIGGPLERGRHFVFANYEQNLVRMGSGPFASNVPTAEQRAGVLRYTAFTDANGNGAYDAGEPTAPAVLDVSDRIAPISRKILEGFIPLPNASTLGANYIANGLQRMNEGAFTVRTDHTLTDRDTVSVRYLLDDQRQYYPFDIFFVAASLPAFPFPNPERRNSLAVSWLHDFGDGIVNEVRFGLNRQRNPIPNGTDVDPASIGLPNGAPQNEFGRGLPIFRIAGFGGTGGQPFVDNLGASTTGRTLHTYADNVSLVSGRHSFKFGGEVRSTLVNQSQYRTLRGALAFNGLRNGQIDPAVPGNAAVAALADYLLGRPAVATISSANPTRGFRETAASAYVQDEWQVSDRLTLNLGLRYEIDTPLTEVNGLLSNLIPGVGNFAVGSPELPRLHDLDANNFGPRAGFAWRVTADGRTTVRAGSGIYFDNGVLQDRFLTARTNAPFAITAIDVDPAPFPLDDSPATTLTRLVGSGRATSAAAVDVAYRTPYAVHYNLSVQRELATNLLAEVAYVGRRGLNMSRQVNINQVVAVNSPAATVLGAAVGSRPFNSPAVPEAARFTNDIIQQTFNGRSTYHALQARLEQRFTNGASFLASYTWSRSIDDVSGIGSGADDRPQDSYDLGAQRAVSNFDVPHRIVFSATYALPFGNGRRYLDGAGGAVRALVSGWEVSTITTAQSGQPFTVTVGSFDPVLQISNRRPDQVGDPLANAPDGSAFDPKAFVAPQAGRFGSVGRNTLRGDGYLNTDLAIVRQVRLGLLGESGGLEVRAEAFNLFNTPNFTLPVASLSSGAFGRYVSSATAPRVLQLAAKIRF